MTTGAFRMPRWCADSWGVAMQYQPQETPILAPALAPSPWMTWSAQGWNLTSGSAGTEAGSPITVPTTKTLGSFAQVLRDVIRGRPMSPLTCYKWKLEAGG